MGERDGLKTAAAVVVDVFLHHPTPPKKAKTHCEHSPDPLNTFSRPRKYCLPWEPGWR